MMRLVKDFLGFGYQSCNQEMAGVLQDCLERPASDLVSAPWLPRGTGLNAAGRLSALAAIGSGSFGLAKNASASGERYKFYYRSALTGNWFAEVWPAWKSALVATPIIALAAELMGLPLRALLHNQSSDSASNLGCFLLGLIATLVFLPRGLLSVGVQFQVAQTMGRKSVEPAGLINLAVGLLGANLVFLGLLGDWSLIRLAGQIGDGLQQFLLGSESFASNVLWLMVTLGTWSAAIMAAAAAFWFVAFQHHGARRAGEIAMTELGLQPTAMQELYNGSFQQQAARTQAPQVALGGLVYVVLVLGFANMPLVIWLISFF